MKREEAISWLTNEKWKNANNKYKKEWNEAFDMAIEALQAEPKLIRVEYSPFSIEETSTPSQTSFRGTQEVHYYEVPSVVRCKDCKNWRESHSEDEESYCYIDGRTTDSTDYCSWGERRDP